MKTENESQRSAACPTERSERTGRTHSSKIFHASSGQLQIMKTQIKRLSNVIDAAIVDAIELSKTSQLIACEPPVRHESKATAQRIAAKLIEALAQAPGDLTEQSWREITETVTREVLTVNDVLKLADEPRLARAVADYAAYLVAPAGSDWALAAMADEENFRDSHNQSSATWD